MQETVETIPNALLTALEAVTTADALPQLLNIAIDAIDTPPQARKFFDDDFIERLAAAIREKGQTWPVKVQRGNMPGRWRLVSGEQRLRACKQAGLSKILAIEINRDLSEAEQLEESLQENELRTSLRPCEEAEALERLQRIRGCNLTELAQLLKFNLTHVSRRKSLLLFTPDRRKRIDAGEIAEAVALEIAKVAKEANRLILFDRALEQRWTKERAIAEVTALTKRRKSRATPAQPIKRVSMRLGERGATIAVACPADLPELTTQEIVYALEFALKEARKAMRDGVPAGELSDRFHKLTAHSRKPTASPVSVLQPQ